MPDRRLGRAVPDEAQVAVARPHRVGRPWVRLAPRTVNVQLLFAEPVGEAPLVELDQLGTEDVAIETVRPLPVADGDDAVVEPDRDHYADATDHCGRGLERL